ncbi:MAG: SDH family Clp fold serine proteinase [Nitrososphaerales archaeon]
MTKDEELADGDGQGGEGGAADALLVPPQTPFFRAVNLARYRRQELIKAIESHTGRRLICYVSESTPLVRDDVVPLMDLLHDVPVGTDIDFLLNTPGGDVGVADKMARILRRRVGSKGVFRVLVADYAKSAGTLLALGADRIIMSDSSELGPIDPQIITQNADGQFIQRPAHTYVDAYDALAKKISDPDSYKGEKNTDAEKQLVAKLDPAHLNLCRQLIARSRELAEDLLKQGMLQDGTYTKVAGDLTDNERWHSDHGAVINCETAQSMGLKVDYLDPNCSEWQAYWRLYCEQRLGLYPEHKKLFESDYASLPIS